MFSFSMYLQPCQDIMAHTIQDVVDDLCLDSRQVQSLDKDFIIVVSYFSILFFIPFVANLISRLLWAHLSSILVLTGGCSDICVCCFLLYIEARHPNSMITNFE